MTDWGRLFQFYELLTRRTNSEYSELGKHMLALLSRLQNDLDIPGVEISTAMYSLLLWIEGINKSLHIAWRDGAYIMSLNAFEDGGTEVSEQDVLPAIEKYLKQLQSEA